MCKFWTTFLELSNHCGSVWSTLFDTFLVPKFEFHIRIESESSKTFRNRIRRPSIAIVAANLENVTQLPLLAHLAHF